VSVDPGTTRRPAVLGGPPVFDAPVTVTRALTPRRDRVDRHLDRIFEDHWFTNDGTLVRELESRLAARLGGAYCAAFCNGTSALQAALRSFDLAGEVITTPFTFPATVHAIAWTGLDPVFCDVDAETWNLDPARAAGSVGSESAALLPVHVFGNPCDVEGFAELGRRHALPVIYDAAHAFDVRLHERAIAEYGDVSVFSFHATKIFHTAEGGGVLGPEGARYERLRLLRNFGIASEDEVRGVGVNGKLSELHAALGLALLDDVAEETRARGRLASRYRERLEGREGIRLQRVAAGTTPNHFNFAIAIDEAEFGLSRDAVYRALRAENVLVRRYFNPLCSEIDAYRGLPSANPDTLPNAHRISREVLCLPLFGDLGVASVDRVIDAIDRICACAPEVRRALA
jgi:dTDP-4-amino-4,6-dideoxygalactose transaminase